MDRFLSTQAAIVDTVKSVNNFVAEWIFPAEWHLPAQETQISHIPDLIRKFWAKKCSLYAGVYGISIWINCVFEFTSNVLLPLRLTASPFNLCQLRQNLVANLRLLSFFLSQISKVKSQMRLQWSQCWALPIGNKLKQTYPLHCCSKEIFHVHFHHFPLTGNMGKHHTNFYQDPEKVTN